MTLNCTGICLDDVPFITSCLKINKLKATFINPSPRTTLFRGHFYQPFSKDHPVYRSLLSPLPRTTLFTGHFYQPLTKDHPVYRPFLSTPHQGPPCLQPPCLQATFINPQQGPPCLKATFINPSARTTLFNFKGHFYQLLTKDHPVYRPHLPVLNQGPPCLKATSTPHQSPPCLQATYIHPSARATLFTGHFH